jgi:hypothetical protein
MVAVWVGPSPACAAEKPPEVLEQEYQREKNPRKQADLARQLIVQRLELLRARIGTGMMLEESTPEVDRYQTAIEMLGRATKQAAHTGTSKNAEKALRDQSHELDNLKILVSQGERPLIDHLLAEVSELREELLYGIMLPPPESEEKATAQK